MSKSYLAQEVSAKQQGVVLVTAMIMLFVVTMLMITAMRGNIADERMAGNAQDWNTAFQAAESALRDAERDILEVQRVSGTTGFLTGCSNSGLCLVSITGSPIWEILTTNNDPGWLRGENANTKTVKYGTYTNAAALTGVAAQPRYIIEALPVPQSGSLVTGRSSASGFNYFYRVTAVGFGANLTSRVVLQGVYRQY